MNCYLPTSANIVREWLFVGHWGICFAKNNGNVSTLVCQMAGCTTCRVSDSWRGEENVISYSCADLLPPTTTMYLGSLSELVLTRMLSKFGAKSLEWTMRPWNPAASAAEGDNALGTLGELQPYRYAYFRSC